MAKALLFLLVTYVLWRWWQAKHAEKIPNRPSTPFPQGCGGAQGAPEVMVPCAHCGVHVPQNEALAVQAEWFCSAEHARLSHTHKPN